jgi:hypothetical protein
MDTVTCSMFKISKIKKKTSYVLPYSKTLKIESFIDVQKLETKQREVQVNKCDAENVEK